MSNEGRKVSLAEVREAVERAYKKFTYGPHGVEGWVKLVMTELDKPRLKPDCPVMCSTNEIGRYAWFRERRPFADIHPLIRADRVMEWVRSWTTCNTPEQVVPFIARRIREETEVQE